MRLVCRHFDVVLALKTFGLILCNSPNCCYSRILSLSVRENKGEKKGGGEWRRKRERERHAERECVMNRASEKENA